jgi:hypothetical protein
MAAEEMDVVRLRSEFTRDGFYKVFIALVMMVAAIILLVAVSFSLYVEKPTPVTFETDADWRVFPPVPVNQAYVSSADLLQWVSTVLPQSFSFDFVGYKNEMNDLPQYYTQNGFKKLTDLLNTYANEQTIQDSRLFIQARPSSAPSVFNQGLINQGELSGSYGWWVQMPVVMHYSSPNKIYDTPLAIQVLVVRIPTLNDLTGIAIEDITVSKAQGGLTRNNG